MRFVIEDTDKDLNKFNDSLRSEFEKKYQPNVKNSINQEHFFKKSNSNADPVFKKSVITDFLWRKKVLKKTTIMRKHISKLVLRQSFQIINFGCILFNLSYFNQASLPSLTTSHSKQFIFGDISHCWHILSLSHYGY